MTALSRVQIGKLIRDAREAKGLSLRQAADQLDIHFSYYRRIETGEYPLGKHARPIAKLLGLDADEFEALAAGNLPNFAPYLRAKYQLDDAAIAELEAAFAEVSKQRRKPRRPS
jgi:transcriptional regulator with XRE-family HTH domain